MVQIDVRNNWLSKAYQRMFDIKEPMAIELLDEIVPVVNLKHNIQVYEATFTPREDFYITNITYTWYSNTGAFDVVITATIDGVLKNLLTFGSGGPVVGEFLGADSQTFVEPIKVDKNTPVTITTQSATCKVFGYTNN